MQRYDVVEWLIGEAQNVRPLHFDAVQSTITHHPRESALLP